MASSILSAVPLICPLDGLPLENRERSFNCPRKHCFDIAADGHINLMPVQFKASRDPGDSKPMVQARRRVMSTGLFQRVAETFSEVAHSHFDRVISTSLSNSMVVDVGCGEGYFTAHLATKLEITDHQFESVVFGIDVSKWAVAAAAARYKNIAWAVASGKSLPVRSGAPKMITTLFGFQFWENWSAVQKSGGLVLIVDAGPEHLLELRELIYPSLRVRDAPTHSEALAFKYELVRTERVQYQRRIADATILSDILEMTPHGHKTTQEARDSVKVMDNLDLTIDVVIRVYKLS